MDAPEEFMSKVMKYHCDFCDASLLGTLLQFCNHIEVSHFNDEPREFLDFEGLVRHGDHMFLAINDHLVKIDGADVAASAVKCPYCGVSAATKKKLISHVHSEHDPVCPKCPLVRVLNSKMLKRHMKTREHLGSKKFTCTTCGFLTYFIETLWHHRLIFHKEQLLIESENATVNTEPVEVKSEKIVSHFKCPKEECDFIHQDLVELKVHVHIEIDQACPHCDFRGAQEMEKHLKLDHASDNLTFLCQNCIFQSSNPHDLWQHRLDIHSDLMQKHPNLDEDNKGPQKCVYCGSSSSSLFELFKHIHRSHDPCCSQCNYVEKVHGQRMEDHMKRHLHVWNDMNRVRCSNWGCVGRFKSLQDYWLHRKTVHFDASKEIKGSSQCLIEPNRPLGTNLSLNETITMYSGHTGLSETMVAESNATKSITAPLQFNSIATCKTEVKAVFKPHGKALEVKQPSSYQVKKTVFKVSKFKSRLFFKSFINMQQ